MSPRILLFLILSACAAAGPLRLCAQGSDTAFQKIDSFNASLLPPKDTVKADSAALAPEAAGGVLRGQIRDVNTGEGVPFAIINFPATRYGANADLEGNFVLSYPAGAGDTIEVRALGFRTMRRLLRNLPPGDLVLEIGRDERVLEEAVIVAKRGEDPALVLMRKVIRAKPDNNPNRLDNYHYEVYNKMEVDLERLSKKQFDKIPLTKRFDFIYNNIDTVSESKPFLPFYLTESLSDYYYQRDPKKTKEFIRASRVKGVNNQSITQFLGGTYQNLNAYDNFILVLDKQFVSPVNSNGPFYYKYKIRDTQYAYGHRLLLVQFAPRREGEQCFYGDMWIVDSAFALQRVSMEVPKTVNINFVNSLTLYQEFAPVQDSMWFCVKEKFTGHFEAPYGVKLPGFIGRKTTSYRNVTVNTPQVATVVNDASLHKDVYVADSARRKSDSFWAESRHDTLSVNERKIYAMIDTLDKMPLFQSYKNTIKFLTTGVKDVGPFEIGPVWNAYSRNPVEGNRFRISAGTTPRLFKDVYLRGYVAYGTRDRAFKYKAEALWLLDRSPRTYLFASYARDIDRSTTYYDAVANDNIFALIFRRPGIPFKLAFVKDFRLEYFKEYYSGFSHMLTLQRRSFDPYFPLPDINVFTDKDGTPIPVVINSEASLRLRYAYKEKFLEGNYYRTSLGSKYPIGEFRYAMGVRDFLHSGYRYHKVSLSVHDRVKIAPFGSLYFNVFAGKIFGNLPYPLLEVHPGNEFYYYNQYAFNMMNRFEFISDEYAGVNLQHNFGGGIFNYIPGLKLLKLRQFWTAKGVIGSLSEANKAINLNKGYAFRTLEGNPYVEVGTGVENIFQFFRIDFVWRVTPKPIPEESKNRYFGIFGSFRFTF